ncbi:Crp/Fnr family transcriptional regulator [Halobacteriovorax sp.]|uniref:Crp/Fnr family transcriptional regulator n=1 Tax=Halobacteriovorax sp. TaxID=2020862 RepID=UPI0035674F4F
MNDLSKEDQFRDIVKIKKGSVLFHEGEKSSYLYIVASGKVLLVKEDQGSIHSLGVTSEKDFIGVLSMFNDEKRYASAIALEETEVYMIKKSDIRKVLKDCPEWVTNIMITLTDRLRDVDELMREHRVVSNEVENDFSLNNVQQKEMRDALKEYRSRRGL